MRFIGLLQVAFSDLRSDRRHFLLASIGIVIGTAALAFFLSLGSGVRRVVLGEIFPLDRLEVVPRTMSLDVGPLRMGMGTDVLDGEAVRRLGAISHVVRVYPKMKLTVPGVVSGGRTLIGRDLAAELIADGVDPALVAGDVGTGFSFADPMVGDAPPCRSDSECQGQSYCGSGGFCSPYVPILASNHLVEIYNGTIRRAHDLPRLNPVFLLGFTVDLDFGDSLVETSARSNPARERGMLVGFSDYAIPLGITIPLGYVKRYNSEFGDPSAAERYHSAIVVVDSKDNVAAVAKAVQDAGFDVADRGAEQAAMLIAIFMAVFALVSIVIVGIAAVNVMHLFLMLVYQRRHEIGIMRAVGARRSDVRRILFSEAGAVGLTAGLTGVAVAYVGAAAADWVADRYIPDFPYKPETFFSFDAWIMIACVLAGTLFCAAGAFVPARRAARMDPARVLRER